jgi:hypothetical protein
VKHATSKTLDRLEPMLEALRGFPALKEKSRGVFYRGSKAFLHFHEHGETELFADVRLSGSDFDRFPVTGAAERKALLGRIERALKS